MEGLIISIILLFLLSAFGNKRKENKRRGRSFKEMSEALEDWLRSLDQKGSSPAGKGNDAHPYADDEAEGQQTIDSWVSMTGEGSYQPEHTAASHMQADDEYDYHVEQAYGEQGMEGEVATQGCEDVKDIRIVKHKKAAAEDAAMDIGNEKLLAALNDLPSAIVAAEILGPPKSKRSRL